MDMALPVLPLSRNAWRLNSIKQCYEILTREIQKLIPNHGAAIPADCQWRGHHCLHLSGKHQEML